MVDRFIFFSLLFILLFSSCKNELEISLEYQEYSQATLGFLENEISENIDSLFLKSRLNYSYKTSNPIHYRSLSFDKVEVKGDKDSLILELIHFLNFENIDTKFIEQKLSNYEKEIPKDTSLLKHTYFVLTEYYQTIEFDERYAIEYSNKLLDLCEKSSDIDFYYFKSLENLVNLEVINRNEISSNSYATQYLDSASLHHPNDIVLQSKALFLSGYALCRRNKTEKALETLSKALNLLPKGECYYDRQEILKIILFICNNYNFEDQKDIYKEHIQKLEYEIQKCGDFCNINKIKGERLLKEGDSANAIQQFLKSYDYILSNNPIDHAQMGSIIYYLYKAYLNVGNYELALNTYYTESLVPLPKKIATWEKAKIFDESKTESTFYFMTIGYYSRVFYEKYKSQKNFSDLLFAKELLDSSMIYIQSETNVNDEDRLLSIFKNSEEVYDLGVLINNTLFNLKGEEKYLSDVYQCSEESKLKILYSLIHDKSEKQQTRAKIQRAIDSLVLSKNNSFDIIRMKNAIDSIGVPHQSNKEPGLLSKVQNRLDGDEVLIDYNIINKELFIHYIYRDTSILYCRPFAEKEDRIIKTLINAQKDLNFTADMFRLVAQDGFAILFPNSDLPYRITIIPDHQLLNLNFEILKNDFSQDMIDSHMIVYSGSGHQYICTPNYTVEKLNTDIAAFFFSDENSINDATIILEELPGNIPERQLIERQFSNAQIYSGKTNSKSQFLKTITNHSFDIIHIATHGYASEENAKDIRLYFRDDQYNLDSIYAYHILDQQLDANLVILSACHSGAGLYYGGEGKFDWARYFILSGAKSVISSLWDVDDRASKLIYNSFYSSKKASYEEKIREAKIQLKMNPNYSHPYYWAGFIYSS